ncbi:MAG: hypothetical protein JSR89_08190 [Proteobacteria bacterium]|nr:hypothetical protein [Pseudomonadota bacterium]
MEDIDQTLAASHSPVSKREKELEEKLGARLLLIWLLGMIASVELLVIVHVLRH